MIRILKTYLPALGLSLIFLGVIIGNFVRSLTGVEFVNLLMALGVLFAIDYRNLFLMRFPLFGKDLKLVLLSQIIILLYALISDSNNEHASTIFIYYSLAIIFAIATNDGIKIIDTFVPVFFLVSLVAVILGLYVITNGFSGIYLGTDLYYLRQDIEEEGRSMQFLYGAAARCNIVATLCLYHRLKWKKYIKIILIVSLLVADFLLMLNGGKRTSTLTGLLICLYFLWHENLLHVVKQKIVPSFFYLFCAILCVGIVLSIFDVKIVIDEIISMRDRMTAGLEVFFGMQTQNYDESAMTRVVIRDKVFSTMSTEWNLFNYIFGYGYMTLYVDQPILQSYFDMGILGLFVYFYIVIVYPITFLRKRERNRNLPFKLLAITGLVGCLTSGLPYGYALYCPIILLAATNMCTSREFNY